MNFSNFDVLSRCKQLISSVLSVALIVNLAAPVAAQSTVPPKRYDKTDMQRRLDKAIELETLQAARESTRVDSSNALQRYLSDPDIHRLEELDLAFTHPTLNKSAEDQNAKADFINQYNRAIEEEIATAQQEIRQYEQALRTQKENLRKEAVKAQVSATVLAEWDEQAEQKIKENITALQTKITAWAVQARRKADSQYEQMLQSYRAEGQKIIQEELKELFDLYKRVPYKALPYLISISVTVLLADGRNTVLFSPEQKELLHALYIEELKNNKSCYEGKETWGRPCQSALNAITGLGILGEESDGYYISNFVGHIISTPSAARGLLVAMSSLLALKQYDVIRSIIHTATEKENDTSNLDVFSVSNWVDAIATINGKYVGEISKWAQFPAPTADSSTDVALSNAWEEIAYMLAEEGSTQSLAILNNYGINQCRGYQNKTLKGETEYKVACSGIKPFLVGALASGKYGQFTGPQVITQSSYTWDRQGRSSYVGADQVQKNIAFRDNIVAAIRGGAKALGVNIPAYLAYEMYVNKMGDLDAETQLFLDKKLFEIFNRETNNQRGLDSNVRLTSYTKNSEQYKERQRRQHRIQVWKVIGTAADIGILIWCIWDLARLATKTVNIGRGIYTASKMARAGQPVAARLDVLYRSGALNVIKKTRFAWPARIKGSLQASVQPLLPQFTKVEKFFPHVPSVVEVAVPTARVTADMGLVVDAAAVTKQLGSSAEVQTGVAALQKSLNTAVQNTNSSFANQRGLRRLLGGSDGAYRWQLSQEIKGVAKEYLSTDRGIVMDFANKVRHNSAIGVPQYLRQLREVPVIDKSGKINLKTLQLLIKPILGVSGAKTEAQLVDAISIARNQTNLAYTHRNWLSQLWTGATGRNKIAYNRMLTDNILGLMENKNVMTAFSQAQKDRALRNLAAAIHDNPVSLPLNLRDYAAMQYDPIKLNYRTFKSSVFSASKTSEMLPITFNVDKGVNGVNRYGHYQRVVFSPQAKTGGYFMGLTDGFKSTNLSNFKIDIPSSQLPALIRGAADAKLTAPIEIKMTPYASNRAFRKAAKLSGETFSAFEEASGQSFLQRLAGSFRGKTKIWTDEVPVYIRTGKGERLVPVVFKTDTQVGLAGSRFVLDSDNSMHLLQAGQDLFGKHRLRFSLPKKQISPLVDLARSGALSTPINLTVRSGRNKLAPLFWTSGLSLSAASSGLITPLETTYKDKISEKQKTYITFVFPYLPSILSPAISPFIMRFGAANVLKFSLGTVAAGLAISTFSGFRGNLDKANPPDPAPLIWTAGFIGASSAMSRSTLNVLINSMGGGGSLLKSMAYKNAGSVFLLAPAFLYGWYRLRAKPAVTGNTLTQAELAKPASDFSLSFPVLLTLSLGFLTWVSAARLDSSIGKASAVLKGEKFAFGKEMATAWKTTFAPEVLPLAVATFAFTGFESAAFSKGTNLSLKPVWNETGLVRNAKEGNRNNTLALLTGISAALVPFAARMVAKPTLGALADPLKPGVEYKRMLGLSYTLNALGGTMLMSYGLHPTPIKTPDGKIHIDPRMVGGIALMGLGTANVTQSFQKLANIRIGSGQTVAKMTAGMDKAAAAARAKELETMTMTSFSWSQLGIAALPGLQGMYVDREKAMDIRPANGPLGSLWIPMTALGASIGLALYGINPIRIPTGLVGGTKLILDGPQSFQLAPYNNRMSQIYRNGMSNKLELQIMQYRIDEQKKMEAAEEKAKAASK